MKVQCRQHREVLRLLADNEAVFVRVSSNNHPVYRFPNGVTVVIPTRCTDWRAWANKLADLRRLIAKMGDQAARRRRVQVTQVT